MVSRRRAPKTKQKPESSDTIHKPKQNIAHYVMYIISSGLIVLALLLYVWYIYNPVPKTVSSKETHNMYRLPSSELLNSAHGLAYSGDIETLKRLVRYYDKLDWSNVQYEDQPSETLIHRALQGRHDSISKSSDFVIGNHEDMISYLVHDLHWNASYGCPIYFALHYRNMKALSIILDSTNKAESLYCLTQLDSLGLTAIHAAAKSKSSGFARLYSRLFDDRGLVKKPHKTVSSLLALSDKPPTQTQPGMLTMQSLTDVILHNDVDMIVKHFGSNLHLLQILDSFNNTIFHIAAYAGRYKLLELLSNEFVDMNNVRNSFLQTPMDLAEIAGHLSIIQLFNSSPLSLQDSRTVNKRTDSVADPFLTTSWKRYLNSGWTLSFTTQELKIKFSLCNQQLPVISTKHMSFQDFVMKVSSKHTPVVLTDFGDEWIAWKNWRKHELIKRYGSLKFEVSNIPYEDLYFSSINSTHTVSLQDYIKMFKDSSTRPVYLFDGKTISQYPKLAADIYIPKWLNPTSIYLKQFILGPRNSGSPPHFHGQAVNALIYGIKEWYFWKPVNAFFSFSHIMDLKDKVLNTQDVFTKCIQLPGEFVYVPENWGHAVINIEESIGVAFEFW